jgi:uncharacterized membrane protein
MQTRLGLLIGLLLLACAARLYRLDTQSIWFDEGWSAYAALQPTFGDAINADPTNPPLYYVLLNMIVRGFGYSEFALRYVSLLLGLLAIPLSYQLGRRLFNPRAGLGAAFLIAISPLLWWASQEARMYTLLADLVLVAAISWHQLLKHPKRWAWLTLWAAELALLYAHNTGPIIALWLNAVTILAWAIRLIRQNFASPVGNSLADQAFLAPFTGFNRRALSLRHEITTWLGGQILVFVLWSPWFINRFLLLPEANSALRSAPAFSLELLYQLWAALWMGSWTMVIQPDGTISFYIFLLFFLLMALILFIPWHKRATYWLITHVVVLTGGLIIGLGVLGNELHGRYLVMIAPLFLVLVGAGLGEGVVWQTTKRRLTVHRFLAYLSATLFLVTFIISRQSVTQNPAYQHDDARGMVQYYADNLTEEDTVLAWSYADRYELAYYWDRLGVKARRVTLPEGADLDTILPLLPTSGDVALNVWYTQRADFRGMMSCLLGNGTVNALEQVSFYGMTNELYRSPGLNLPELELVDTPIADLARLTTVGALPASTADKALCLPLQLTLTQPTNADLKAVVIVQNDLGWEIARDDAPFADAAQRTTSLLAAGAVLTAYPLLRLPLGAPPGDYSVFLRVYDEQAQPSGYDFLPADMNRPMRDFPLGVWTVEQGADWSAVNHASSLPVQRDLPISEDLILLADNIQGGIFRNGDEIRLELLWQGDAALPDLTLAGEGGWTIDIPAPTASVRDDSFLDWRTAQIPLGAPAGNAVLSLPDGTVLSNYRIESVPAIYDAPEFAVSVDAIFPGVGTLVGYTLENDSLGRAAPFDVMLIWRADETPDLSYTVFVQLLNADGVVIAQADSVPAANARPTNGWRPGEYIVDMQRVTFHEGVQPAANARLIAGLYDPATGARVPLTSGADFITLNKSIPVR